MHSKNQLMVPLKAVVVVCIAAALNGCAFVYDNLQDSARDKCERGLSRDRDQVKACQERHRESYEEYEKRRKQDEVRLGPEKIKP